MDQDVYGGYNKQQIGSLTTEGEGEFQKSSTVFFTSHQCTCLEYSKTT
jgi:hypothetical protein